VSLTESASCILSVLLPYVCLSGLVRCGTETHVAGHPCSMHLFGKNARIAVVPAIPTADFRDLPRSLQANVRTASGLHDGLSFSNLFVFSVITVPHKITRHK